MSDPNTPDPLLVLLQLQRRARQASTSEALGFIIVNETLQLTPYRQAVLWRAQAVGGVAAVSGLPQADPTAPYVQWSAGLCRHLIDRGSPPGEIDRTALPESLRAEWADWLPAHALWLPLGREPGTPEAGLLLARDLPWGPHETALLNELADAWSHALAAFRPRDGLLARWRAGLRLGRTRRWLLAAALAACLMPVRLTALAEAEVVPQDPFVVRAPLDGVIERLDVRPNESVQVGTPLFSLDTTSLRARMALARKAVDAAEEEYRQSAQSAVTSDKSRTEMALRRGQLEEKAVEMDYTARQLERVQVKAERSGAAVFSDAGDWVGRAVTLGERVLLVADPTKVELAAWLPAADLIPVAPGDILTLYPQGTVLASHDATVTSVSYRAELTRDGFLAYRVKARFAPGTARPRLGQLGTARFQGGWAPLAYVILRRPIAVARQWLGW